MSIDRDFEEENQEETEEMLINPLVILLQTPLYEVIELKNYSYHEIKNLEEFEDSIDAYCIDCQRESVFWSKSVSKLIEPGQKHYAMAGYEVLKNNPRSFHLMLTCSRDDHHVMIFYFKIYNEKLIKVGQFPSIADLEKNELEKYRKVLSRDRFNDFKRGIGLVSHGIGVGSFVYLRRIFEELIAEAHNKAIKNSDWVNDNEKLYEQNGVRIVEKIQLLRDYLPDYLVQNRNIYGILSKGIHTLTEKECLEFFPALKIGIELILDEKLEKISREEKIAKNRKEIQSIANVLGNK